MTDYTRAVTPYSDLSALEAQLARWYEQLGTARNILSASEYRRAERQLGLMRQRLQAVLLEIEGLTHESALAFPALRHLHLGELKRLRESLAFSLERSQKLKVELEGIQKSIQKALIGAHKPRSLRRLIEKLLPPLEQRQRQEQAFAPLEHAFGKAEIQLGMDPAQNLLKLIKQKASIASLSEELLKEQDRAQTMEAWLATQQNQLINLPFQAAPTEKSLHESSRNLSKTAGLSHSLHLLTQARRYLENILSKNEASEDSP